jgi:hypothetical protein
LNYADTLKALGPLVESGGLRFYHNPEGAGDGQTLGEGEPKECENVIVVYCPTAKNLRSVWVQCHAENGGNGEPEIERLLCCESKPGTIYEVFCCCAERGGGSEQA